jgi:MinD superfamily P-loop ATPase
LFLDCDVENPNAHLFLDPTLHESLPATVPVPRVDLSRCTLCGDCGEVCRFNAVAVLGEEVRLFPELCHGCGSCTRACPTNAISEEEREIGILERGRAGGLEFARGLLNLGEPQAVPVIRQLKVWAHPKADQLTVLDAPPGTSCPMVETVQGSDFVVLVTEPTPTGLHDLELAHHVLGEIGLPAGVIVNRDGTGYGQLEEFCAAARLPVLLRIPFDRGIAAALARGQTLIEIRPEYSELFSRMTADIRRTITDSRRSGVDVQAMIQNDLRLSRQEWVP